MKSKKYKEGLSQNGLSHQGIPSDESSPNNINVEVTREGSDTDLPIQVPKMEHEVDDIDFDELQLSQNFKELEILKKEIVNIPVRIPGSLEYIHVHSDPAWTYMTWVLELKDEEETYIIAKELWGQVSKELKLVTFFTAITWQGTVLLIPVEMPGPEGEYNIRHSSLLGAIRLAKLIWVRIKPNVRTGGYASEAFGLPKPVWPDITFKDLFKAAFKDRIIKDADHPVLQKLRRASS